MSKSTAISWAFGDLTLDVVVRGIAYTPEMIEMLATKSGRAIVARARQLNMVNLDEEIDADLEVIEPTTIEARVFPHPTD